MSRILPCLPDLGLSTPLLTEKSTSSPDVKVDSPKREKRKLNHSILKERLASVVAKVSGNSDILLDFDLEDPFEDVLTYKGHKLRANLLHYALQHAFKEGEPSARSVRAVLKAKADPLAFAKYTHKYGQGEMQAIHIACGLSYIPALEALWAAVPEEDRVELVQMPSRWTPKDMSSNRLKDTYVDFYHPLHDACYHAQPNAIRWLLEKQADVNAKDKDGCTALHVLAKNGCQGDRIKEQQLPRIIQDLIEAGADLDEAARPLGETSNSNVRRVHSLTPRDSKRQLNTPFLLAVEKNQFPKEMLYLLVKSYWHFADPNSTLGSIFDDLRQLARCSVKAATYLYDVVNKQERQGNATKAFEDAQRLGAIPRVAGLLFLSPQLGTDILDVLLEDPKVIDRGHCPIWSHANLCEGVWALKAPMRCAYVSDSVEVASDLRWPSWAPEEGSPSDMQRWQQELYGDIDTHKDLGLRLDGVFEVTVKVLMLPGVVDLDILWALARVPVEHKRIFLKLSVQAIIQCTWRGCRRVIASVFMLKFLDLVVCFIWGFTFADHKPLSRFDFLFDVECGEKHMQDCPNSPAHWVPWCIMAADGVRGLTNAIWAAMAYWSRRAARHHVSCWLPVCPRRRRFRDAEMQQVENSLWNVRAVLRESNMPWDFVQNIVKLCFLCMIDKLDGTPLTDSQQAFLTVIFLVDFYGLVYTVRTARGPGRTLLLLCKTLLGSTIQSILVITCVVYGAMVAAFCIIKRTKSTGWINVFAYRALMFGDGDGLDHLGMDPDKQESEHDLMTGLMFLGTLVFSILIFNLLIAIYENEFDTVEKAGELYFQQERARAVSKVLLETAEVVPKHVLCGCHKYICKAAICSLIGLLGVMFSGFWSDNSFLLPWTGATLLAIVQILGIAMQVPLLFCSTVNEEVDDDIDWTGSRDVGAKFFRRSDRLTEAHRCFLWVCHRRDLFVAQQHAAIELATDGEAHELARNLATGLSTRVSSVEEKLQDLIRGQQLLVSTMATQHEALMRRHGHSAAAATRERLERAPTSSSVQQRAAPLERAPTASPPPQRAPPSPLLSARK
mmetsp:Transcript_37984/g.88737  ORF Transcript_37984/g.88737 Transcript_37984/m.88737 type:complete len:1065 (-) Transcript_37984:8-3202(-)